jgi:hypothetical protein
MGLYSIPLPGGMVHRKIPPMLPHLGQAGDPLSLILFNFIADCLTRMIRKAQTNSLITGLAENLISNGIAVLQYADDTIICLKYEINNARNMKLVLYLYEMMSNMKMNFTKSEVIMINGDEDKYVQMADFFPNN